MNDNHPPCDDVGNQDNFRAPEFNLLCVERVNSDDIFEAFGRKRLCSDV